MAWIAEAYDKRLQAFTTEADAAEFVNTMNHYGASDAYSYREVGDGDEVVNTYPPDAVPEAGGYGVAAICDDGGILCEWCVRDPFNPVHDQRDRPFQSSDGWGVVGWFNTGEVDEALDCDHCGRVIVEGE